MIRCPIKNSFIYGAKCEDKVIALLENAGLACEKSQTKDPLFDIKAQYGLQTVFFEVKYDYLSSKTGNIAIEYHNPKSNKPSGVNITMADFWVICLGTPLEIWMTDVYTLKDYLNNNKAKKIIDVAGDYNASLYLYPKDELLSSIFYRIDNMDQTELESCVKFYVNDRANKYLLI